MSTDQYLKGAVRRMGPGSVWWGPVTGQRDTGHKLEPREFHLNVRKKFCAMRLAEP